MKRFFWLTGLLLCAGALADPQIPDKLVGIWTTDGSTLQGEKLIAGRALYLDVDGVGAIVSINGTVSTSTRMVVTGYTENDHHLEMDATDQGQVQRHLTLNYDEATSAMESEDATGPIYHRRKLQMSPAIRQSLGLEPAPLSVPPPVRRP